MANEYDFIRLRYTQEEYDKALEKAHSGKIPYNSLEGYPGMAMGILCENATELYLGDECKHVVPWNPEYDLIFRGWKIDVKGLDTWWNGEITGELKTNYYAKVPKHQWKWNPDLYVFARYNQTLRLIWLVGWVDKKHFMIFAKEWKKGDKSIRPNGTIFTHKYDNLDLEYEMLEQMNFLKDIPSIKRHQLEASFLGS